MLTLRSAPTTFHLSAQAEEIRIYTGHGTNTSALAFGPSVLMAGDARIPLDGAAIRLSDGVTIRLHRLLPDTLSIVLEADSAAGSAGTVHRDQRLIRTLGPTASFRIPLAGSANHASFLLPFRATAIEVGNVAGFATRQRTPLLRSGHLILTARTLTRRTFDAGAYTISLGQRVDVPAPGSPASGVGTGFVLVDGDTGMNVEFTMRARSALISSDNYEETLAAAVFDRVANDQWLSFAWVLVVTLVLSPIGSVIADRMKKRAERSLRR